MDTFINDIKLDYSTFVPRGKQFTVTSESVQSSEFSDIARHVKEELIEFTLNCSLTKDDREENFIRLIELSEQKGLVTLLQDQEYENLIIIDISESDRYDNNISFDITFKQITTVEFEKIVEIKEEEIPVLQEETIEGFQSLTEQELSDNVINELFAQEIEERALLEE